MDIITFTEKIADCFNQTPPEAITPETRFKELEEWGSMLALIVIAMIDADYGKTITSDDLKRVNTVADLFAVVQG